MVITLVDDDDDDLETFREAISELDSTIQCITYSDCSKFLHDMEEKSIAPDVIFLDLNMPKVSGRECISHIKKKLFLIHVPVFFYTTSSLESDKKASKELGASGFVTKPSTFPEIKRALHQVLVTLL